MTEFDHAVVGAGIVGSWTALRLLGLGKKVLLLDQFSEPHTRGSSQGQSRIIRITHVDKFITEMMPLAFEMWEEVEEYTKKELIVKTGFLCLDASKESSDDYKKYVKYMKETSPENVLELTATEMVAKYDGKLKYDSLGGVFLDKTGGIMLAHKALLTVQDLYRLRGGTFWDNCQVSEIIPEEEKVKIVTAKGDVVVRSVVVCAGPWTKKLLTPKLIPSL
ncbi:Peroxisomal sarcosine oxidase, partial [Stegodyphus mimosarum]